MSESSSSSDLVEGWEEDMSISSSDCDLVEGDHNTRLNELEKLKHRYIEDSGSEDSEINDINDNHCSRFLNFSYIHDQDMNYYQEAYNVDRPNEDSMLGPIADPNIPNEKEYDPDFDKNVNDLLADIEQDLETETCEDLDVKDKKNGVISESKKEQYEDDYNEFQDEEEEETPQWYDTQLQSKVKSAKHRLNELSRLIFMMTSDATRDHIRRMESDHNTNLCKLDYPRHASLKGPWLNYWKFNCNIKCKFEGTEEEHAHTSDCEILLLEHVGTNITTLSRNIFQEDFPDYIMHVVELFQQFADCTSKDPTLYDDDEEIPDTVYEKPTWQYLKIRSNHKKELQLTVCGKGVKPLMIHLKRFFHLGPGKTCNVVSLYCINIRWSQKKGNFPPTFLNGSLELRDKVGPITIRYTPKTSMNFNSIEAVELGKIMTDYLAPNADTTFLDVGCNIGALSLMLSFKCDKVIGLNTLQNEVDNAEVIKSQNEILNATFMNCQAKDVATKCLPLIKRCETVAAINVSTPYGKSHYIYTAMRNLPSIWRVVVYGTFTTEIQKQVTKLTCRDEYLGDEFMPMRALILDKSPSIPTAFDLVILFERKPLIEPSIKVLSSGPTVHVHSEENWDTDSGEENKDSIKKDNKGHQPKHGAPSYPSFKPENSIPKIDPTPYSSIKCLPALSRKKLRVFDCPSLPVKKEDSEQPKNPPVVEKPVILRIDPPIINKPHPHSNKKKFKMYDCPSLPVKKESSDDGAFASVNDPILIQSHPEKSHKFYNGKPYIKKEKRSFDVVSVVKENDSINSSLSQKVNSSDGLVKVKIERPDHSPSPPSTLPEFDFLSELRNQQSSVKSRDKYSSYKVEPKKERRYDSPSPPSTLPEFDFLDELRNKQPASKSKDKYLDYKSETKRKRSYDSSSPSSSRSEYDYLSELRSGSSSKHTLTKSKEKYLDYKSESKRKRSCDSPSPPSTRSDFDFLSELPNRQKYSLAKSRDKYLDYIPETKPKSRDLKRIYDCPSTSEIERHGPLTSRKKSYDLPVPMPAGPLFSPSRIKKEISWSDDEDSSINSCYAYSPVLIKKEKEEKPLPKPVKKPRIKIEPEEREEGELSSDTENSNSPRPIKQEPIDIEDDDPVEVPNKVTVKTEPTNGVAAVADAADTKPIQISGVVIKTEPIDVEDSNVNSKLIDLENDTVNIQQPINVSGVVVKTEPIDTQGVVVKTEPIDLEGAVVKTEPVDEQKVVVKTEPTEGEAVTVNTEPMDTDGVEIVEPEPTKVQVTNELIDVDDGEPMTVDEQPASETTVTTAEVKNEPTSESHTPISNLDEFENMKTPLHVPTHSPTPPPATANFTTVDGFAFTVKPNQSFLTCKKSEPTSSGSNTMAPVVVKQEKVTVKQEKIDDKQEPGVNDTPTVSSTNSQRKSTGLEDNDDEISIIGEKRDVPKKELKERLKYVMTKQKNTEDSSEELLRLIEQRKKLQKELGVQEGGELPRQPRRYRSHRSPESPGSRRSPPSKDYRPRSPSPYTKPYRRSPPSFAHYRRSRSPDFKYTRRASPTCPRYSPTSPVRAAGRAPYASRYGDSPPPARYRSSPSPPPRYAKRSSSPPARYSRRSPSPAARYSRRSPSPPLRYSSRPLSPLSKTYSKRSPSPYRRKRSPFPNDRSKFSRSPVRKSRSKSPISSGRHKSKSNSHEPSPSSRKHRDHSPDDKMKKKKKKKKREDSSSEHDDSRKKKKKDKSRRKSKEAKNDGVEAGWDIPVLSTLATKPAANHTNNLTNTSPVSSTKSSSPVDLSQEANDAR